VTGCALALALRADRQPRQLLHFELTFARRTQGEMRLKAFPFLLFESIIDCRRYLLLVFPTLHDELDRTVNKMCR
jgi:hypothetical protein